MSRPIIASALTVGELARRLGEPVHRVEYIIRARGLKPASWAGNARIFLEADLAYIASELRRIREERGEVSHE